MGTATLTRSQSRKTRPICNSDSFENVLLSPFVVLPGNNVDSSVRRQTRREAYDLKFVEKENAPPSTSRLTEGLRSESKVLPESFPKKVVKKRKQSEQVSKGSHQSTPTTTVETDLQTPVILEKELSSPRPDGQVAEKLPRSCLCPQIEPLSDHGVPLARRTCDPLENQIELQSSCLNIDNSAKEVAPESLGQRAATGFMGDQRKDVGSRQVSNDAGAGAVLPSSSALVLLQKDYERLFSRYKKLKAQRLDEVDALYNEQNSRISDFVQATEALLEFYKGENLSLKQQMELASSSEVSERCKCLEKANVECRNELLQEQAKGLELRQENKKLKTLLLQHIADKQKLAELVPVQGSQMGNSTDIDKEVKNDSLSNGTAKLVHRLLECVLGLQLSCPDGGFEPHLHFHHRPTGFSFDIKEAHDTEIAELVEGGELLYQNVSVGVCKKAIDWMKEKELIFGMNQAQMLFKRLIGFLNRGFC
ncbi:hypothetical protein L7F22_048576 [Adiantum nelumboides]|nr:hypothetical protein [Adiantum nelumboides]